MCKLHRFFQVIVISIRPEYNGVINSPQSFTPQDMLTYEEAHRSPLPAAYVSFEFAGNDFDKYQKFVVGRRTRKKRSSDVKEYENKPLQPNTNYRVFLRAFVTEVLLPNCSFVIGSQNLPFLIPPSQCVFVPSPAIPRFLAEILIFQFLSSSPRALNFQKIPVSRRINHNSQHFPAGICAYFTSD